MIRLELIAFPFAAMACAAVNVEAAPALTTTVVASGLSSPLFVTHAPNDQSRIFIVEQCGRIRILSGGNILGIPFINLASRLTCGGELGLLGLAFHPSYASNGFFYVNYTDHAGATVVARYSVSADPNVANITETPVLRIAQPFANHNGGWIAFGPDGYLYIAMGDGGDANDPGQRAQDITGELLGKMLRIDVNGDDFPADATTNYAIPPSNPFVGIIGDDEIWDFGLRNPWRNSFDRLTGDLYIGDVGQDAIEEVDFEPAGSTGGRNYGWDCREGTNCITSPPTGCSCSDPTLVPPIHEYPHVVDNCSSITGGYVYRGCSMPELQGTYFFADYCRGQFWSFRYNGTVTEFQERTAELGPISGPASFGEDELGELYICAIDSGKVYKIVPQTSGPDCNANTVVDSCDIATGTSADANHNSIPDECEPPVPTVSECGGITFMGLIVSAGTLLLMRRRLTT